MRAGQSRPAARHHPLAPRLSVTKKGKADRDYQGSITVAGTEYWLSAWLKTSKKGTRFMSLSVKPKAIRALDHDDVLVVTRLDRLARSTRDLLNTIDAIAKRGAGFRSLKDTWADTTTAHGRLMLTVLGGLAEFERTLISERTGEGRKRAMERGVRFGRPTALDEHQRREALKRLRNGESQADVARTYRVSQATISRLAV